MPGGLRTDLYEINMAASYLRRGMDGLATFSLYVRDLPKEKANRVFVRGMAGICRGLGVKTVAEGVESEDVMEVLPELGVDRAQGWHVGFPEPELPTVEAGASLILPRRPRS